MIDMRRLRYFVTVVEEESISGAARMLNVAQPAVSQAIAGLETFLDVRLLERSASGVRRTPAGDALYWHACQILKQVDRAFIDVKNRDGMMGGAVVVGLPVSTAGILSLPILRATLSRLPMVRLQINAIPSQLVWDMLRNGRIDIGVVFDAPSVPEVHSRLLLEEELVFITASPTPPGEELSPIELADIADCPLLIPGSPNSIHQRLTAAFEIIGKRPHVIAEIDALTSLVNAVRSGLGSTVLPWAALQHALGPGIDVHRIVKPSISRPMYVCHSRLSPQTRAAACVEELVVAETHALVQRDAWKAIHLPA